MPKFSNSCYLEYGIGSYDVAFDLFQSKPVGPEALSRMSRDLMLRIADNCVEKGARYIGHIKSYLKAEEGEIRADTIGAKHDANVESTISKPLKKARLFVSSIVQGIDKSEVQRATLEAIYEIARAYGFNIDLGIPLSEISEACYLEYGVSGYGVAFDLLHSEYISPEALSRMLRDLMLRIADNCVEKGARYIGHIKSYLKAEEGEIRADTIGAKHDANVESTISKRTKNARLVVNSIVQGIDKSEVQRATLEAIYEITKAYGFNMEVDKEHLYYDDYGL